jgi:hypothetical protein
MCQKAQIKNAYTAELLLTGILRQKIDLEQYPFSKAYPCVHKRPFLWVFLVKLFFSLWETMLHKKILKKFHYLI